MFYLQKIVQFIRFFIEGFFLSSKENSGEPEVGRFLLEA
jgi:hypothetical protein